MDCLKWSTGCTCWDLQSHLGSEREEKENKFWPNRVVKRWEHSKLSEMARGIKSVSSPGVSITKWFGLKGPSGVTSSQPCNEQGHLQPEQDPQGPAWPVPILCHPYCATDSWSNPDRITVYTFSSKENIVKSAITRSLEFGEMISLQY